MMQKTNNKNSIMKNSVCMITQIFLLGFLISSSCHKDTFKQNIKATEYFPNKPGNYWEYSVYDSLPSGFRDHPNAPRQYTVRVTVTGVKNLADNIPAMVWRFEYPWGNEIKYYRIESDSIKVYDTVRAAGLIYIPYPNDLFIKPFFEGQKWKSNLLWIDSFHVSIDTLPDYQNILLIHRDYIGQQTYYHDDYWFSQNIGFVKIHFNQFNTAPSRNEYWELKYYNLK